MAVWYQSCMAWQTQGLDCTVRANSDYVGSRACHATTGVSTVFQASAVPLHILFEQSHGLYVSFIAIIPSLFPICDTRCILRAIAIVQIVTYGYDCDTSLVSKNQHKIYHVKLCRTRSPEAGNVRANWFSSLSNSNRYYFWRWYIKHAESAENHPQL